MNDDANRHPFSSNPDSSPRNGAHPSVERLSEYLDGSADIGNAERSAIEGHLASCQECRTTLENLRMVVDGLAALPVREAPRSFAITRDMLEPATSPAEPEPVVLQESAQWHARHADKVRWATAVAAILFVFVISADLVTNGLRPITSSSDDDAPGDMTTAQEHAASGEADETISALRLEEPDPVPTTAIGSGPDPDSDAYPSDDAPEMPESDAPQMESADEADEDLAVPESADEPASDDAQADQPDDAVEPASDDDAEGEDSDVSMFSVEEEAVSDEPAAEPAASSDESSSRLGWRVAEFTLALVLALLLAVMIGLPKQRGARRR